MSSALFLPSRSKYGGMDASMMARMNEHQEENHRLKKMVADEPLTAEIIQDAMQKSDEAILPTRGGTMGSDDEEATNLHAQPMTVSKRALNATRADAGKVQRAQQGKSPTPKRKIDNRA
jgi:hypothetical protein